MTENDTSSEKQPEAGSEPAPANFYEASRKVLLAAVGAAAIAQDEVESFVKRLSDRGAIAEKEASKLAKEMWEKREKLVQEQRAWIEAHKPSVASKSDIEELTRKVEELTAKVEELRKEKGKKSA
jgi:polyhydroxyalkanoate synthesis regulator phasin